MAFEGIFIGIDLGTTNSRVAVIEGKTPKVIKNDEGSQITPSVVSFKDGELLVGTLTQQQAVTNSQNTFCTTKRLIGQYFDDFKVQREMEHVSFGIVRAINGEALVKGANGKVYAPHQISAIILMKMKKIAESYLGKNIQNAVITVPAFSTYSQRKAAKLAGKTAGLNVTLINETTAAALTYGIGIKQVKTIAVYHFGGGTFDISILDVSEGYCVVKSTFGDTYLGGKDFDNVLVSYLVTKFNEDGINIKNDKVAMQKVQEAAEKAKIELSSSMSTEISLSSIITVAGVPKHMNITVTRALFESLTYSLIEQTITLCKQVIEDADVPISCINEVVLVGGMTKMPLVQVAVERFFGRITHIAEETVVIGAAIQGGIFSGNINNVFLLDVTPHTLSMKIYDEVLTKLVIRNTTIPTLKREIFSTCVDGQRSIDISVYEGEGYMPKDNKLLGHFQIVDIPPAPKGTPYIEVTFHIDINGMVYVSVKDIATGQKQQIVVIQ